MKAVWSTAFVNNLPDSAFLHILPGGKKDSEGKITPRSLRMFPYKDSSGKIDLPHLRNAIARIPQSNRIDAATKKRLQAKARRLLGNQKAMSLGQMQECVHRAVREMSPMDGMEYYYCRDVYPDSAIIDTKDGSYRATYSMNMGTGDVTMADREDWTPVKQEWVDKSAVHVFKDKKGQWWFLGVYSNKYQDRDAEILSEKAHKEYIKWLDKTGFQPVITAYHQPRMPLGFWSAVFAKYENKPKVLQKIVDFAYRRFAFAKVQKVFYLNGFTYTLAKFLPGKEKVAKRLSKISDLGMSHGFIVKEISDSIIDSYRTFEMSVLKRQRAANLLTRAMTLLKDGMSMAKSKGLAPKDRKELVELFNEEIVAEIEEGAEKSEKILDGMLAFKDVIKKAEEEEQPEEETPDQDKAKKPMMDDDMMDDDEEEDEDEEKSAEPLTVEVLAQATDKVFVEVHKVVTALQAKVDSLEKQNATLEKRLAESEKRLKKVEKSDDEKLAEQWMPGSVWMGGFSASKSDETVIDEDEKEELTENKPAGEGAKKTFLDSVFWDTLQKGN